MLRRVACDSSSRRKVAERWVASKSLVHCKRSSSKTIRSDGGQISLQLVEACVVEINTSGKLVGRTAIQGMDESNEFDR